LTSMMACFGNRDTLAGSWDGEWLCGELLYDVESVISEQEKYEYDGQMLFSFDREVSGGTFYATLLYEFDVTQMHATGNQELFFAMEWVDVGCKTILDDNSEIAGGCQSNGLNTEDLKSDVGDVPIRFDGSDRLIIDDGNCQGILYR